MPEPDLLRVCRRVTEPLEPQLSHDRPARRRASGRATASPPRSETGVDVAGCGGDGTVNRYVANLRFTLIQYLDDMAIMAQTRGNLTIQRPAATYPRTHTVGTELIEIGLQIAGAASGHCVELMLLMVDVLHVLIQTRARIAFPLISWLLVT